jgi:hypothetical protein
MATSTRTTFTASPDGPQITVEQRVSQSVARRALRQIEAVKQQPSAPALAAPGGMVQRPGGEPLRPRATQATGATPVGSPVQYNQGIATGQPVVGGDAGSDGLPVGWQVGEGDPTTVGVVARYPEDRYLDESTLTLYYWQQLPGEAAAWVAVASPTEAFPFRLDGQDDGTYVIDPYQHYRVRIEALEGVSGATVTVSPAVGDIAEVGDAISITVSGSESGTPVLGTILLRRVG